MAMDSVDSAKICDDSIALLLQCQTVERLVVVGGDHHAIGVDDGENPAIARRGEGRGPTAEVGQRLEPPGVVAELDLCLARRARVAAHRAQQVVRRVLEIELHSARIDNSLQPGRAAVVRK